MCQEKKEKKRKISLISYRPVILGRIWIWSRNKVQQKLTYQNSLLQGPKDFLQDGIQHSFKGQSSYVSHYLFQRVGAGMPSVHLCCNYPKKDFTEVEMSQTLLDLGLAPSAALTVLPVRTWREQGGGAGREGEGRGREWDFTEGEMSQTLLDLGLAPSAALTVLPVRNMPFLTLEKRRKKIEY